VQRLAPSEHSKFHKIKPFFRPFTFRKWAEVRLFLGAPEGTWGIRLSGNRGVIYGYFRLVAISVIQGIGSAANELPVGSCSSDGLRGAGSLIDCTYGPQDLQPHSYWYTCVCVCVCRAECGIHYFREQCICTAISPLANIIYHAFAADPDPGAHVPLRTA